MDQHSQAQRHDGDEIAALLRGLRLGFIALISAAATAAVVIGLGEHRREDANPYYGELTRVADN